ncbi:tetratricopeptide repeat protein [Methyloversatilis thermotolerans]|uniref:tetratricopeptide repeat protein n=1 Tax=Methyloversatilis thermotolerans TaxID=1346290 RepID=UPI000379AB42|nr:tetratricopeptide repeat protein [Methyloversatilis thermotolerans]
MRARRNISLMFSLFLGLSVPCQAQSLVQDAAAHIEAGRYADAYRMLSAEESERAGDPQFDLLLGIAALETGRHTLAVFALERVLAVQPDNARARAEIGRAYMALGESEGAKRELQAVRGQDVPPEVVRAIDRLLAAIDRAALQGRTAFSGYVEAAVGRDTNVNSATSLTSVTVPSLGAFVLDTSSRSRSAWFSALSGGVNVRVPVNPEWALIAGASGAGRFNGGESRFDTTALDGNGGVVWSRGQHRVTALLQAGMFEVDQEKLRDYTGGLLQWQYTHDARNQTTVYAQQTRLRYEGSNDVRDVNRNIYGVGHAMLLPDGQTLLFGSVYLGAETGRNDLSSGINIAANDVIGFRFGAQHSLDERWQLFGALSHEARDYHATDPVFGVVRDDTLTSLSLGASYEFAKNWLATPSLSFSRNDSSISLNEYRRGIAQFAVRRTF